MCTLIPLFIFWNGLSKGDWPYWQLVWLVANWAAATSIVYAMLTNLTKLSDRVETLEQELKSKRSEESSVA